MTGNPGLDPIASLSGIHFLYFYYILITIFKCATVTYENYVSGYKNIQLPINVNEDPLFIAWLKDPAMGMVEFVMGPLIEGEFIGKVEGKNTWRTIKSKKPGATAYEYQALRLFKTQKPLKKAEKIFPPLIKKNRNKAEKMQLILSKSVKKKIINANRTALIILMVLGLYKLIAALCTGHYNIGYLLISIFIVIPIVFYKSNTNAIIISPVGKHYLQQYSDVLLSTDNKTQQQEWLSRVLLGSAIMANLYASEAPVIHNPAATNSSDSNYSGSSCSGSSCSGSSCGGSGCGGCGSR